MSHSHVDSVSIVGDRGGGIEGIVRGRMGRMGDNGQAGEAGRTRRRQDQRKIKLPSGLAR